MTNIYTIYKITNIVNNKSYIGFTGDDPTKRFNTHLYEAGYTRLHFVIYKAMRKHGISNFIFDIIYQSIDKDHTLNTMEEYFIKYYNSHINQKCGYNMTYGGEGSSNHIISNITREKLRQAKLGRKLSDDTKEKIRNKNTGVNHPMYGKKVSYETKKKISESMKGKKKTLEHKQKLSESLIRKNKK